VRGSRRSPLCPCIPPRCRARQRPGSRSRCASANHCPRMSLYLPSRDHLMRRARPVPMQCIRAWLLGGNETFAKPVAMRGLVFTAHRLAISGDGNPGRRQALDESTRRAVHSRSTRARTKARARLAEEATHRLPPGDGQGRWPAGGVRWHGRLDEFPAQDFVELSLAQRASERIIRSAKLRLSLASDRRAAFTPRFHFLPIATATPSTSLAATVSVAAPASKLRGGRRRPPFSPELRAPPAWARVNNARSAAFSRSLTIVLAPRQFLARTVDRQLLLHEMNPRWQVEHPVTARSPGSTLSTFSLRIAPGSAADRSADVTFPPATLGSLGGPSATASPSSPLRHERPCRASAHNRTSMQWPRNVTSACSICSAAAPPEGDVSLGRAGRARDRFGTGCRPAPGVHPIRSSSVAVEQTRAGPAPRSCSPSRRRLAVAPTRARSSGESGATVGASSITF